MSANSKTRPLIELFKRYGFTKIESRESGHIAAYHPRLDGPVFTSSTASDHRTLLNAEAIIRQHLGLSGRGRTAVEGTRRKKKPKRRVPQQRYGDGPPAPLRTLAEIRAERRLGRIDQLMRERPY